jgi:hypothetical protein
LNHPFGRERPIYYSLSALISLVQGRNCFGCAPKAVKQNPRSSTLPLRKPLLRGHGGWMNRKTLIATGLLVGVLIASGTTVFAQDPRAQAAIDEDIKLFRKDVRSGKKQIVAANMSLTDSEAQQFWPIYDQYTVELATITDSKYSLIKEYAQNYNTLTGEQAEQYVKGRAAVEQSIMELRLKYFPIFRKVLSGKATALFFQMDWRLGLVVDLQLASQIPLVEP